MSDYVPAFDAFAAGWASARQRAGLHVTEADSGKIRQDWEAFCGLPKVAPVDDELGPDVKRWALDGPVERRELIRLRDQVLERLKELEREHATIRERQTDDGAVLCSLLQKANRLGAPTGVAEEVARVEAQTVARFLQLEERVSKLVEAERKNDAARKGERLSLESQRWVQRVADEARDKAIAAALEDAKHRGEWIVAADQATLGRVEAVEAWQERADARRLSDLERSAFFAEVIAEACGRGDEETMTWAMRAQIAHLKGEPEPPRPEPAGDDDEGGEPGLTFRIWSSSSGPLQWDVGGGDA